MSRSTFRIHKTIRLFGLIGFGTLAFALSANAQVEPILINLSDWDKNTKTWNCCLSEYGTLQYMVPEGKRLVIEQVFLQIETAAGANARGHIEIVTPIWGGSSTQRYPLQFTRQGLTDEGRAIHGTSQVMKLYITNPNPSGSGKIIKVRFVAHVFDLGNSSTGTFNGFSGYLETLP